jgi:GNAT superfamily N-acetyltransferase
MRDPHDKASARTLQQAGFSHLAELVNMQCDLEDAQVADPPADVSFRPCGDFPDETLQELVAGTYRHSLDCPALAGRREMQDVLTSHRLTGTYCPESWWVITVGGEPAGCIFVNKRTDAGRILDVVYMGVLEVYRGQRLGQALLSKAARHGKSSGAEQLALAVDAANHYAMRLYQQFGFLETDRRTCWIRLPDGPLRIDCA